jgi:hypothetical protein
VLARFLSEEEKQLSVMVNGTIYLARPIVCPPLVQGSAAWVIGLKAICTGALARQELRAVSVSSVLLVPVQDKAWMRMNGCNI